jgi:hypothetical protein
MRLISCATACHPASDAPTFRPEHGQTGEQHAAHQYIDEMLSPAEVLILSLDEFVDVVYPWTEPPS